MSRVLDQPAFVAWFDKFMPAANAPKFKTLWTVSLDAVGTGRRGGGRGQRGGTTTTPPDAAAQPPATGEKPATPPAGATQPPPGGERGAAATGEPAPGAPGGRGAVADATPGEAQQAGAGGPGGGGGGGGRGGTPASPRATWTGLAFTRADAYARLAGALPANDPRVPVFKRLSAVHAEIGQRGLNDPAAFDAPWIGTFAVSYLTTTGSQR